MRPLEPFRLSNLVSVNVSPLLRKQAQHYAATHDTKLASVVRSAIQDFIHDPFRFKAPNIRALLMDNPSLRVQRGCGINLTLLPQDREQLDALSRATNLPNAALIRRALYEYTKTDSPASLLPELLVDAWGDQPLHKMPQARPPEKRRKKKTPTPTALPRTIATGTKTAQATEVDVEGFNEEFGKWMR